MGTHSSKNKTVDWPTRTIPRDNLIEEVLSMKEAPKALKRAEQSLPMLFDLDKIPNVLIGVISSFWTVRELCKFHCTSRRYTYTHFESEWKRRHEANHKIMETPPYPGAEVDGVKLFWASSYQLYQFRALRYPSHCVTKAESNAMITLWNNGIRYLHGGQTMTARHFLHTTPENIVGKAIEALDQMFRFMYFTSDMQDPSQSPYDWEMTVPYFGFYHGRLEMYATPFLRINGTLCYFVALR